MTKDKFNTIMPESDDRTLCVMIDEPISGEGYAKNFLPRFYDIVERHGEIRLLIYYKAFHGREKEAAGFDMETTSTYGKKIRRLALVNPPESEALQKKIQEPRFDDHALRLFEEKDLDQALRWVKG